MAVAEAVTSPAARPFIKWAGGKRKLVPEILKLAPASFGRYYEPFVGGGALFFALRPKRALLNDRNIHLARSYLGVQRTVETVIEKLSRHENNVHYFNALKACPPDKEECSDIAAWFIYLNKTGFNGMYRVNKKGEYNIPFGKYENPNICDRENLFRASAALAGAVITSTDFEVPTDNAKKGDFVYFDPPYLPKSKTANFTSYTKEGFGEDDHRRLAACARRLKNRGVHVVISESDCPLIREIFAEGFQLHEVSAARSVSCKASTRGKVGELLIT